MNDSVSVSILEIVRKHSARTLDPGELTSELPLGSDGLGLDSIALAEVVLEIEQRFGVSATSLLDGAPLTFGRILQAIGKP